MALVYEFEKEWKDELLAFSVKICKDENICIEVKFYEVLKKMIENDNTYNQELKKLKQKILDYRWTITINEKTGFFFFFFFNLFCSLWFFCLKGSCK